MTALPARDGRAAEETARREWWLFSPRTDLGVFLGSALLSLAALFVGARAGLLESDSPDWAWVPAVLLIDVAHVYATAFRVYFDAEELRRRLWLYALVPVVGLAVGVALYSEGEAVFWRSLAYLAVFHFVRQQYGWVALYRARVGERGRLGHLIDAAAVYMATVYPLIYWHANMPRRFAWFLAGDFAALPQIVERVAWPVYCLALGAYAVRSLRGWLARGAARPNPGKDIVVATTAVCWYAGIVAFDSDYAFTVTNVVIHGVPYFALVYFYARARRDALASAETRGVRAYRLLARGPIIFLATLWLLAYAEELLWDRSLWHERAWLFGAAWDTSSLNVVLVPLLALPQLTHYVLDGFVWRRKSNPTLSLLTRRPDARPPT
ncbi:MAG TPA: hypothetical protein VER32_08155 [Pyrinomonadaceae bacterium]|nr:hypothetical protein [Pyrinomonadaceae bacterium]